MSLALDDKQFIRSIADLIINNPEAAQQFFSISDEMLRIDVFLFISDLIQYVKSDEFSALIGSSSFINNISEQINKIENKEVKNIFLTSLSMSEMRVS